MTRIRPTLAIWGASGHAMVVADIVRADGLYEIVGFLDDAQPQQRRTTFCEAPILGGRDQLPSLRRDGVRQMIIAVGDNRQRLRLAELALEHGFSLAAAIHPQAALAAGVSIGPGSVVAAGAVINPGTRVGENVIVNTLAGVDHECHLDDGAHIGPGAHLGGNVSIGRAAQVAIGATVINQIQIGAGSLIGAGAVVVDHIPEGVEAYGVPARIVRTHDTAFDSSQHILKLGT